MMKQRLSRAALCAALGSAMLLAACDVQPTPQPVAEAPPPPSQQPPPALLGDLDRQPQARPYAPPPAPTYAAPPPASSGPVIIAMAPIPNPPERARAGRAAVAHRHAEARRAAPAHAPAARPNRLARAAHPAAAHTAAPVRVAKAPAHPAAPAPAHVAKAPPVAAHPAPAKPAVIAKAAPPLAPKPVPKPAAPAPKLAQAPAAPVQPKLAQAAPAAPPALAPAPALKVPAPPATPPAAANAQAPASPLGDRATRLASLETALAETVRKTGKLTTPGRFVANQPADVVLVLPANFSEAVREAAAKNGLVDAAAAVNLTASLGGDGYAVTPGAAQSQPLVPGQPTEFHWTVNAMPGARGALHADIGADLLGAGSEALNLGSVQAPAGGGLSPRMLGAGVLVLLALLVIGFLARGPSNARSRPAEVRRRQPVNLRDEPG